MVPTASSLATVMAGPSAMPSQALASVLLVTMVTGVGKVHASLDVYIDTMYMYMS